MLFAPQQVWRIRRMRGKPSPCGPVSRGLGEVSLLDAFRDRNMRHENYSASVGLADL